MDAWDARGRPSLLATSERLPIGDSWRAWSSATDRLLLHLDPVTLLLLVSMNANLGDLSITVLLLLAVDLLLNLSNLINNSRVGRQSRAIVISTITKRVGAAATILIRWAIYRVLNYPLGRIFLFGLIYLF